MTSKFIYYFSQFITFVCWTCLASDRDPSLKQIDLTYNRLGHTIDIRVPELVVPYVEHAVRQLDSLRPTEYGSYLALADYIETVRRPLTDQEIAKLGRFSNFSYEELGAALRKIRKWGDPYIPSTILELSEPQLHLMTRLEDPAVYLASDRFLNRLKNAGDLFSINQINGLQDLGIQITADRLNHLINKFESEFDGLSEIVRNRLLNNWRRDLDSTLANVRGVVDQIRSASTGRFWNSFNHQSWENHFRSFISAFDIQDLSLASRVWLGHFQIEHRRTPLADFAFEMTDVAGLWNILKGERSRAEVFLAEEIIQLMVDAKKGHLVDTKFIRTVFRGFRLPSASTLECVRNVLSRKIFQRSGIPETPEQVKNLFARIEGMGALGRQALLAYRGSRFDDRLFESLKRFGMGQPSAPAFEALARLTHSYEPPSEKLLQHILAIRTERQLEMIDWVGREKIRRQPELLSIIARTISDEPFNQATHILSAAINDPSHDWRREQAPHYMDKAERILNRVKDRLEIGGKPADHLPVYSWKIRTPEALRILELASRLDLIQNGSILDAMSLTNESAHSSPDLEILERFNSDHQLRTSANAKKQLVNLLKLPTPIKQKMRGLSFRISLNPDIQHRANVYFGESSPAWFPALLNGLARHPSYNFSDSMLTGALEFAPETFHNADKGPTQFIDFLFEAKPGTLEPLSAEKVLDYIALEGWLSEPSRAAKLNGEGNRFRFGELVRTLDQNGRHVDPQRISKLASHYINLGDQKWDITNLQALWTLLSRKLGSNIPFDILETVIKLPAGRSHIAIGLIQHEANHHVNYDWKDVREALALAETLPQSTVELFWKTEEDGIYSISSRFIKSRDLLTAIPHETRSDIEQKTLASLIVKRNGTMPTEKAVSVMRGVTERQGRMMIDYFTKMPHERQKISDLEELKRVPESDTRPYTEIVDEHIANRELAEKLYYRPDEPIGVKVRQARFTERIRKLIETHFGKPTTGLIILVPHEPDEKGIWRERNGTFKEEHLAAFKEIDRISDTERKEKILGLLESLPRDTNGLSSRLVQRLSHLPQEYLELVNASRETGANRDQISTIVKSLSEQWPRTSDGKASREHLDLLLKLTRNQKAIAPEQMTETIQQIGLLSDTASKTVSRLLANPNVIPRDIPLSSFIGIQTETEALRLETKVVAAASTRGRLSSLEVERALSHSELDPINQTKRSWSLWFQSFLDQGKLNFWKLERARHLTNTAMNSLEVNLKQEEAKLAGIESAIEVVENNIRRAIADGQEGTARRSARELIELRRTVERQKSILAVLKQRESILEAQRNILFINSLNQDPAVRLPKVPELIKGAAEANAALHDLEETVRIAEAVSLQVQANSGNIESEIQTTIDEFDKGEKLTKPAVSRPEQTKPTEVSSVSPPGDVVKQRCRAKLESALREVPKKKSTVVERRAEAAGG